jgi:amino acid adenylation domain-containing protein
LTAAEILSRLEALGMSVVADEGRLRVSGPRGQIDDELKAAIARRKDELLALVAGRGDAVRRIARDGALPLSAFQERLWVLQRLDPDSTDYNIVSAWRSDEAVDAARVVAAIRAVVARHEILRSTFVDEGGQPSVRILGPESVAVDRVDLGALEAGEQQRVIQEAAAAAAHAPFDLTTQPPLRCTVYAIDGGRAVALIAAHHVAVDAWSLGILGREIQAALEPAGLPPPPREVQYVDFAAWERSIQRSAAAAAELEWWRGRLAGVPPLSTLPTDRPRSDRATGGARAFAISPELSEGIRALARAEGATVYMALVAAMAVVLRWHTGQDDLVIAMPMGTRERPELEEMIGPFVNLLALRLDLSGDPSFAELLRRTRAAVLDAHEHRDVPFEKIVEEVRPVRSPEHAPLVQVAVVQHNAPVSATTVMFGGGAIYDLTCFFRDAGGQLGGGLEYRSDLYAVETIDAVIARVEAVLAAAVADRQRRLSEVSLLTPEERRRVLEEFNATAREIEYAPFATQLARQAARTPDAVAVVFEGASLTYRELDRRANQVARHLHALGVGRGVIAGIWMPRSLDLVVALAGIHRSGAAYLPLDPDFPPARLAFMLADSGAAAVITAGELPDWLEVPPGVAVIDVAAARGAIAGLPDGDVDPEVGPGDLAYLIYTSGSTGKPKGVRVRHGELVNFLASMRDEPGLGPGDVLAAVTTLSFDIAALELYLPLVVGARVVVVSKSVATHGDELAELLRASGATVMQATPSTWRLLVEAGWKGAPGFRALCGGEGLPPALASEILGRAAELWNLYGPTETTVWSTAWRVEPGHAPVLIGRPIANTQIYILDRAGQPLPPGIAGEIWIAGTGVAEGYHGRPELTAERFVPDRFRPGGRMYRTGDLGRWDAQGRLEHLGRADHQVKVRGFRIELAEIETVLGAHPAVRQAVVLAREAAAGDVRLVGYVVHHPGEDTTVSELRRFLRKQLPDYMIPSLFVTLDAIPLTPNGKLDRGALPDPFAASARGGRDREPPAPGNEQLLAEIWREILRVDDIAAEDNFFEIGGHSLLSLRVAAAVEKRTGRRMDPRALFFKNLRQIAATLG